MQVSDFLITPILGYMAHIPEIRMDLREVDEVIYISLEALTDPANLCEREMNTLTGRIEVPGYEIDGNFIWVATAMMLAELIDLFSDQL